MADLVLRVVLCFTSAIVIAFFLCAILDALRNITLWLFGKEKE
jgi:hypothetical protein